MEPVTDPLIKEITDIIVEEVNPRQVILFGSRARGTAGADSDLDFLIVQDKPFGPGHSRRQEMARLWRRLAHFPTSQDFLIFTPQEIEEWRDTKNHVIARALEEGKLLYERA
jgi:predicted nucleotidyltransferase